MVFICLRINQDLKLAPAAAVVFSSGLYEICPLKANIIRQIDRVVYSSCNEFVISYPKKDNICSFHVTINRSRISV